MLAQIIEQQNLGCTLQEQLDSVFKDFMPRADQFFDNQHWRNEFKQMLVSAVIGCDGDSGADSHVFIWDAIDDLLDHLQLLVSIQNKIAASHN